MDALRKEVIEPRRRQESYRPCQPRREHEHYEERALIVRIAINFD